MPLESYYGFAGEGSGIQAAIDEAGRGSWAGRVYTAAVVWNPEMKGGGLIDYINDSKRLSPSRRDILYDFIIENAIDYSVSYMEPSQIDSMNILNATIESMHNACRTLTIDFDTIIVDGNLFKPYLAENGIEIPSQCIIKGDSKYIGIACASILAKVEHDRHMREIAKEFPHYIWDSNMGYGSSQHRDAIAKHGLCKYHRMSFEPMKSYVQ